MRTNSFFVVVVVILFLGATGCESRITGHEGNLEFSYPADDRPGDFNKPIAVGAKLELKVEEAGTRRTVDLQSAETDDPEILSVVSFSGQHFILQGEGSGSALVSVTAQVPSGDVVSDSVSMLGREPEVLKLNHTCDSGAHAHYLVDHDVLVAFDMEMSNGQPVIGYGYHPVEFDPADGVELNVTTKDQQFMHLRTRESPGEVTILSQLDDTEATMVLVEKQDIDGCRIGPGEQGPAIVGFERVYHLLPTVGDDPVCQAVMEFTVEAETPEICSVKVVGAPVHPDLANERGWIRLDPHEAGTCTFTATFSEGTDATESISVEVKDP